VIPQTSKLQTFANIIRVFRHEPTSFMDVSQINAEFTVQNTLMGLLLGSAESGLEAQIWGLCSKKTPI